MTNWVKNEIRIEGSKEALDEIQDTGFVLNKLVPMPAKIRKLVPNEEFLYYSVHFNQQAEWHDWTMKNWGTKWEANLCEAMERVSQNTLKVCIKTEEDTPIHIFKTLVKQYNVKINVSWEDECPNCLAYHLDKYHDYYSS